MTVADRVLLSLFAAQGGDCFYCGRPTWLMGGGESRYHGMVRLGVNSKADLRRRMATVEHLQRRVDGGVRAPDNLVMSCAACNHSRHATPVLLHLAAMRTAAHQQAAPA